MNADDKPTPQPEPWQPETPSPIDGRKVVEEAIERARTAPTEWVGGWKPEEERE